MKILLLGHTGFLGQNVERKLKDREISYVGVSRKGDIDLRSRTQLLKILESDTFDIVINCAAHVGSLNYVSTNSACIINDNTQLISAMYEAVRILGKDITIINPIANCSYPGHLSVYTESEWQSGAVHPSVASYGSTRRLLVAYADAYRLQYGVKSINFLVPNMYGPLDSCDPNKTHALNALVSKFVKADIERSNIVKIWGSGNPVREWLYVEDFADLILKVIIDPELKMEINTPLNIGQNKGFSVREIADAINEQFNNRLRIEYMPNMPDGAMRKVMDDRLFRCFFPNFEFSGLTEGVRHTIEYYVSQYPY
jgi:GDP-L-fucose synthase